MEAEDLERLIKGIEGHFRMAYSPNAMDLVWNRLLEFPEAASKAVSRRLLLEFHATPGNAPTLGALERMLEQETSSLNRQAQAHEDAQDQHKRNPGHVHRTRSNWLKQFGAYERARLRMLQGIAWDGKNSRQQVYEGLDELRQEFSERADEISVEMEEWA